MVQWLRLCHSMQGFQVPSLVGSQDPTWHKAKKAKHKISNIGTKFNKGFKIVHIKKKSLKKINNTVLNSKKLDFRCSYNTHTHTHTHTHRYLYEMI